MKADAISLSDLFSTKNVKFIIPVYQRNYDWNEEQCNTLFKDVENIYKRNKRKHFVGSIVYVSNNDIDMIGDNKEFVVIDGQQRITTTMLFLKALYDISKNDDIKDEILEDFLINKRLNDKLKLKPIKKDNETFKKIILEEFENINKQSKLYNNYENFKKWIIESDLNEKDLFTAFKKLWVVHIALNREEDDPQLIFESINSTGLGLKKADLIRNFILMDKPSQKQEELFEQYWIHIENNLKNVNDNISSFFHHYLVMKFNRTVKLSDVYNEFKEFVYQQQLTTEELLSDILYFNKIYSKFLYPESIEDKDIKELILNIKLLKMTVVYPYLLELFNLYKQNMIDKKNLIDVLQYLESYSVRRLITNKKTSGLNKVFMNLAQEIKILKEFEFSQYSDYFAYVLLNKKGSAIFPRNEEFQESFIHKDIYNIRNNDYILLKLENFNNKEKVTDNLTIEHIMPQTLTKEWKEFLGKNYETIYNKYLHTIGNLTLTGYNSELGNKPFNEKKELLKDSKLELNKFIVQSINWDEITILERANLLFKKAKDIWLFPNIDLKIKNNYQDTYSIEEPFEVTYRNIVSFHFFQDEEVSSWIDFTEKFLLQIYQYDYDNFNLLLNSDDERITKIISSSIKTLRDPKKILENVYINKHGSANNLISNIKYIYSYLNYDESETALELSLLPKKE